MKVIITQTVEYGMGYNMEKIREAVEDAFPMRAVSLSRPGGTKRRFKRTVKYWEGAHIKRGIDGITYVPRTPPAATYYPRHDYGYCHVRGPGWNYNREWHNRNKKAANAERLRDQWQMLCNKADEEERAEREFATSNAQQQMADHDLKLSAAEAKYQKMIDTILENGQLYWRARLKWKQNAVGD